MATIATLNRPVPLLGSAKPPALSERAASVPSNSSPGLDHYVPSPARNVGVPATAAPSTLKDLIRQNRDQFQRVQQAKADASRNHAAMAAWQDETAAHLQWLSALNLPAGSEDFRKSWLADAADRYLEARPLKTQAERLSRFQQLFAEYHSKPSMQARALLAAASKEVSARAPVPLSATSPEILGQINPALSVLGASKSPLAQELARQIRQGSLTLHMVTGQEMGTQFYAVVNRSAVNLSNGQQGPNFFELSPPFQAATLLHEYTHVKQKERPSSFLSGIGGNLIQRTMRLTGMVPGANGDRMENLGMRYNQNEQEAYGNQKAFLQEMGLGNEGLNAADEAALVGIDTWLEAAK